MANKTIIEAARMAYTPVPVDISAQIDAMATVSQMGVALAEQAMKRTNQLDKAFNAVDWLNQEDLYTFGKNIRNSKEYSHGEKMQIFEVLKNDTNLLGEWSADITKIFQNNGADLSGALDMKTQTWLSSIITGNYFGSDFDFDIDGDNKISQQEKNLKPLIIQENQLSILSPDGNYIPISKLPSNFIKKSDGNKIASNIQQTSRKVTHGRTKRTHIEQEMLIIKNNIENDHNAEQSLMYDHKFSTRSFPKGSTFVDYFLRNSKLWDLSTNKDLLDKLNASLAEIDNSTYDEKVKISLKNNLFKEIATYTDVKDDFFEFIEKSIKYSLRDLP